MLCWPAIPLPPAGGCFSPESALHGDMAGLRVWSRVLSK